MRFRFWDRYFNVRVPLLGQGQSMFGSVVNLIPLMEMRRPGHGISVTGESVAVCIRMGTAVCFSRNRYAATIMHSLVSSWFFWFRLIIWRSFPSSRAVDGYWVALLAKLKTRAIRGFALFLMELGNWEVLNSGTVKESVRLDRHDQRDRLGLTAFTRRPWQERLRLLRAAAIAGVVFFFLCAPLWRLCAGNADVVYDLNEAHVYQIPNCKLPASLMIFSMDVLHPRMEDGAGN